MTILQISILAVVALVLGRLPKGRQLALLAVSIFVVFWLQPVEPFAKYISLAFWLPVATLTITGLAWILTSAPEMRTWKQNWPALAILVGIVLLMDLNRHFKLTQVYISTTPSLTLTSDRADCSRCRRSFINTMAQVSSNYASRCIYNNHLDLYFFEDASINQ